MAKNKIKAVIIELAKNYSHMYRGEKKRFASFAKQQPGRARQTTYKLYFSALYVCANDN